MLYATHKAGGCLAALIGFEVLNKHGLLIPDMEPWLQLILMYPAASFGSTLPDLDHHWGSVKEHTPFSFLVHKIIHLTKPKHRSWQTHCWVLTAGFCALLWSLMYATEITSFITVSQGGLALIRLMFWGLTLGIGSHLFLDTFTRMGTWLIPGIKFRLVPNSEIFSTGTRYETIVRGILYVLIFFASIWVLNPFNLQSFILGCINGGG